MTDVLGTITMLRQNRGWTEYQLVEHSGLPQSTISSWYRKQTVPTIPSLEKVCFAFGITLTQLLSGENDAVILTDNQHRLIKTWAALSLDQQNALLGLLDSFVPSDPAN